MPNMGSASLLVTARDKGFFEKMGITVDLVEFQGGPAEISAMASGDIDIAQIGHGAHALCAEGEAMIFEIDCTSLADAVMGNKEKGVNSIADLKGKKSRYHSRHFCGDYPQSRARFRRAVPV